MGYADFGIEVPLPAFSPRQYIVFSVSTHGRAVSGVFSITWIESLSEILSH
jgi:hypothetical protein